MSRVRQKQRRIASAQHSTQKNGIVIQFDEKFLSSPPAAHQLHRPPHTKSKRLGQKYIHIYRNFTQPSKIGFYLATIKKEKGPDAPQQEKILSLSLLCATIFPLLRYFFLVQHTYARRRFILLPLVRAAPPRDRHPRSDATTDEKAIIGNIAGSFSSALHE